MRHSGLDPESRVFSERCITGCRLKIPLLAGIKPGMTDNEHLWHGFMSLQNRLRLSLLIAYFFQIFN
jgi:hypothetical protein